MNDKNTRPEGDATATADGILPAGDWIKPEVLSLDLETAQATGPGIPGG